MSKVRKFLGWHVEPLEDEQKDDVIKDFQKDQAFKLAEEIDQLVAELKERTNELKHTIEGI